MLKTGRGVPGGTYKRLMRGGTCVMSNTPDEIRDFMHFVHKAHGSVLINGLGLGVLVKALLQKEDILKIRVIEQSEDVINLVANHINDSRVEIVHADAFEYKPLKGETFDFVWHDIWDYICGDNTTEMATLHRKYARKCTYQDSWAKAACQRQNREYKRQYAGWR